MNKKGKATIKTIWGKSNEDLDSKSKEYSQSIARAIKRTGWVSIGVVRIYKVTTRINKTYYLVSSGGLTYHTSDIELGEQLEVLSKIIKTKVKEIRLEITKEYTGRGVQYTAIIRGVRI